MKKASWIAPLLLLMAAPHSLLGQGFGIGARAGTLGLGGEVALGLSDVIVVRGGLGAIPYEYDGEFEGNDYKVTLPPLIGSAGIDLYPGGKGFRIMGGMLWRSGDVEIEAPFEGSREIGGTTYTSSGTLFGTLTTKTLAPFAGIGFGKHTGGGFGFSLDLGLAFVGEPEVTVTGEGPVMAVPGINADLQREADKIKEDAGGFLKYWPIASVGLKIPLG